MRLTVVHFILVRTPHGTTDQYPSACMLTILPLQLLSCIFAVLFKSADSERKMLMILLLFLYFKCEALTSSHHASASCDENTSSYQWHHYLYSHGEELLLLRGYHLSCHTIGPWPDYFLTFPRAEDLRCQVERYLHKYSCYFSAQSVIYRFSRLLNSPV